MDLRGRLVEHLDSAHPKSGDCRGTCSGTAEASGFCSLLVAPVALQQAKMESRPEDPLATNSRGSTTESALTTSTLLDYTT